MTTRSYVGICVLLLCLLLPGSMWADMAFNSGAGQALTTLQCNTAGCGSTQSVAITPHPLWEPNHPNGSDAVWISNFLSGYQDSEFQPYEGMNPVFTLPISFNISRESKLALNVWADDTAGVTLDGVLIWAPIFTQSTCSGGVIGCRPGDGLHTTQVLAAGDHTLEFASYQVGRGTNTKSNPFGLLYNATVTSIPEPGMLLSLALMGPVLLGATRLLRKRA